jgi:hypothetical protein
MRISSWIAAAIVTLSFLPDAQAFVRTTTCSSICHQVCPSDGVCQDGGADSQAADCELGEDCADCGIRADPSPSARVACEDTEPLPIAWLTDSTEYTLDSAGYPEVGTIEALQATVDASFTTWNEVAGTYFVTEALEPAALEVNNLDATNVITFVERDWAYAPAALALASVTYAPGGEIVDADIEVNADDWTFKILGSGPALRTSHDIQNTLTHEIGHFLGMDHCHDDAVVNEPNCDAVTMRVQTEAGDITMRDLSQDDIAAAQLVYPSGGSPPGTSASSTETSERGCACSSAHRGQGLDVLFAILGLALIRRRSTRTGV